MTEGGRQALLQIARVQITARVTGLAADEEPLIDELRRHAGAFVTLHRGQELRGCIGQVEANQAVGRVVARCAAAACSEDPRFPPVTPAELQDLDVELSLLGPLETLTTLDDLEIGRHGLIVEHGRRRGLLLPQVAVEWSWDRLTFVEQTCGKAGISKHAWKDGARLWRFEAEIFAERLVMGPTSPARFFPPR